MVIILLGTPFLNVHLEDICGSWLGTWRRGFVENPWPPLGTLRMLMVPDLGLGGWGHLLCHRWSSYMNIRFYAKFHIPSMIMTVKITGCPWGTWRMLMVPDWGLRGWKHLLCHRSSSYMIISLYAKFKIVLHYYDFVKNPWPLCGTWRMSMDPDLKLEGWGHLWHLWSSRMMNKTLSWTLIRIRLVIGIEKLFPGWVVLGR